MLFYERSEVVQNTLTRKKSCAKYRSSIGKIDALDLTMVKMKLCLPVEKEGKGWMPELADNVEVHYKRFLKLCLLRSEDVVPSKLIDEMWHAHILDTRKYQADCRRVFGHYVHHFPYFGLCGEEDAKRLQKSFEATIALFEEYFGEAPIGATSSQCQGGGTGGGGGCSRN